MPHWNLFELFIFEENEVQNKIIFVLISIMLLIKFH